tara:strand:+ start:8683 stop:9318 length:636 start_codon:yes stop_codon:yes gene_type:complete
VKIIYYYGKDTSIYDSLQNIIRIKNKFILKKIDVYKNKNLESNILILDDSFKGFLNFINLFSKKSKNNLIITTKKENISLSSIEDLRIFIKPIKILDLYKEIIKRIKKDEDAVKVTLNKSNLSLINPHGKSLKLTEKEFKLIELLLNNKGKELNKKNILFEVWGLKSEKVGSLDTRVLETLISRIRRKIRSVNIKISITKNINGYVLNSQV